MFKLWTWPGETVALASHAKFVHQGSYFGWNAQFILKRINRVVYPILRVSELQYFSSDSGLSTSDLACTSSDLMLNTSDFHVEFCTFRFWIFVYHPIFAIYAIFPTLGLVICPSSASFSGHNLSHYFSAFLSHIC